MRRYPPVAVIFAVMLPLLIAGCTGLLPGRSNNNFPGTVHGIVLGADGMPAAGIVVSLADVGLTTVTDSEGTFSFVNVPPGQHRITVSYPTATSGDRALRLLLDGDEPVFLLGDEPVAADAWHAEAYAAYTESVTITARQPKQVQITLPVSVPPETVTIVGANPPLGTGLSTSWYLNVEVDVSYKLVSQRQANVVVLATASPPAGDTVTLMQDAARVDEFTGHVTLGGRFRPARANDVTFTAALLNTEGDVLAINRVHGYFVTGGTESFAPEIILQEVGPGYVTFGLYGGNRDEAKSLHLQAKLSRPGVNTYEAAMTADVNAFTITDKFAPLGNTVTYYVTMLKERGTSDWSNSITVDIPNPWVTRVTSSPAFGNMVAHPTEPIMYAVDTHYNRIVRISTADDRLPAPLPVGSQPRRMSISADGNTLYVTIGGADKVAAVDTSSSDLHYIDVPLRPYDLAVDSQRNLLYVTSDPGGPHGLLSVINLATGDTVHETMLENAKTWRVLLSPHHRRVVAWAEDRWSPHIMMNADDLSIVAEIDIRSDTEAFIDGHSGDLFVWQDQQRATHRFSGHDLSLLDTIPLDVRKVGPDNQQYITVYEHRYGNTGLSDMFLRLTEWDNDSWAIIDAVGLGGYVESHRARVKNVQSTADGGKTYYTTTSGGRTEIHVVDHSKRDTWTPWP